MKKSKFNSSVCFCPAGRPAIIFLMASLLSAPGLRAQDIDKIINPAAVEQIEKTLSSDDMRGRASFSPDIERAADFIESQFKKAGLKTWNGSNSYRQPFSMIRARVLSARCDINDSVLPMKNIAVISSATDLKVDKTSGYELEYIRPGGNLRTEAAKFLRSKKNCIVLVDSTYAPGFSRMSSGRPQFKSDRNIIFLLTNQTPDNYSIEVKQDIQESPLANVVGILPGKSRKNEFVIFSAHYDHLGVRKPDANPGTGRPATQAPVDSIYNGANDDASGTTAVIMLADYFAKKKDNERTIVFAAFTAEEIGEFGSQYFSSQFDPQQVVAMFNIEMIGTESKWGTNSAYITGFERSDMGQILQKNLTGSQFAFNPDPYPQQQLFYRSDNASLARQGVPAHTISTSKMDSEKFYHTTGDEIGTLDMQNMARIIKAIAISSQSIVAGKDTPSRVDTSQLR
jgi:hypothetical protein